MATQSVQQMADRVAALMQERLRLRGAGLPALLRQGGRKLPRKVRAAAQDLAAAAAQGQNPHLRTRIDQTRATAAYQTCMSYLGHLGAGDRRLGHLLSLAASLALIVLVVFGGVVAVLVWRGYL